MADQNRSPKNMEEWGSVSVDSGWDLAARSLGETTVSTVVFVVVGDVYRGESPWDFLCSSYPERPEKRVYTPETFQEESDLRAELEAWDAASDEVDKYE